jgi:hypothetical protein
MKRKLIVSFLSSLMVSTIAVAQEDPEKELENLINELKSKQVIVLGKQKSAKVAPELDQKVAQDTEILLNNPEALSEELELIAEIEKTTSKIEDQFDEQVELEPEIKNADHIYLLNIPVRAKIYANKDFFIFPHREGMIFDDGKIVATTPFKYEDKASYCYVAVEKSGSTRIFPQSKSKALTITVNNSLKKEVKSTFDHNLLLEIYETTFGVDNQHIKAVKCITSEKGMPMTIGDFKFETGGQFEFEFPAVVDIFTPLKTKQESVQPK